MKSCTRARRRQAAILVAFACACCTGCSRGMVPAMRTEWLVHHRRSLIERLAVECGAASAAHCAALHGALRNINNELRERGVLR